MIDMIDINKCKLTDKDIRRKKEILDNEVTEKEQRPTLTRYRCKTCGGSVLTNDVLIRLHIDWATPRGLKLDDVYICKRCAEQIREVI